MKITVDTKDDSHDDIRKVIKMLQNLVGDSQEIFMNQDQSQETVSPIANIFGDASSNPTSSSEPTSEVSSSETESTEQSTEDLFAELFSEEELKKMDTTPSKEEEDEEKETPKSKSKKYDVEFY